MSYDINTIKYRCERLAGIRYLDTVDSTNQEARRIASQEACDGLIVWPVGRAQDGEEWDAAGVMAEMMPLQ